MEATRDPRLATTLLIYDEVQRALDRQFEQIQLLNGRAQQLLGFSAIVVGVMIGLRPPTHGWVSTLLFAIAFLFLMLVVFCGYQAWSIRGWRHDPQPRKLWERYRLWPDAWLRQQLILNWIASQTRIR